MTKSDVLRTLQNAGIFPDRLIKKTNTENTFVFKRAFYYTMGISAKKYAEKIKTCFPNAIFNKVLDDRRSWPTTSYFVVEFTI